MPRRENEDFVELIQLEREFKCECLARNPDYIKLCRKVAHLRRKHKGARDPAQLLTGEQKVEALDWINSAAAVEGIPSFIETVLSALQFQLSPEAQLRVAELQRMKRLEPPERAELVRLAIAARQREQAAQESEDEAELDRISHEATRQFGVPFIWDPRPYLRSKSRKRRPPPGFYSESIVLLKHLGLPEAYTDHFDAVAESSSDPSELQNSDARLAGYCDFGENLHLVLDVRLPINRLRFELDQLLVKIDRLQRAGQLAAFPKKPDPVVWARCLLVWDLRMKEQKDNDEVARTVFPVQWETDPGNARSLASQDFRHAKYWISMEWAQLKAPRPKLKRKGVPISK